VQFLVAAVSTSLISFAEFDMRDFFGDKTADDSRAWMSGKLPAPGADFSSSVHVPVLATVTQKRRANFFYFFFFYPQVV